MSRLVLLLVASLLQSPPHSPADLHLDAGAVVWTEPGDATEACASVWAATWSGSAREVCAAVAAGPARIEAGVGAGEHAFLARYRRAGKVRLFLGEWKTNDRQPWRVWLPVMGV